MDTSVSVIQVPAAQRHTATVIFVHVGYSDALLCIILTRGFQGLGHTNLTWRIMITEALAPKLPNIEWILPQALV